MGSQSKIAIDCSATTVTKHANNTEAPDELGLGYQNDCCVGDPNDTCQMEPMGTSTPALSSADGTICAMAETGNRAERDPQ
jgi:hypothetical protein